MSSSARTESTPLPKPPPSHLLTQPQLPADKTLKKRPLLHPPAPTHQTTLYLTASTSFMAANTRIEKALRKNPTKPLHVKASGRAIARAVEVAAWWMEEGRSRTEREVKVVTGGMGCVDDVVEDDGVEGGRGKRRRTGKKGEGKDVEMGEAGGTAEGSKEAKGKGKEEGEELEFITRMTSTIELIFPVPADQVVPGNRRKRGGR